MVGNTLVYDPDCPFRKSSYPVDPLAGFASNSLYSKRSTSRPKSAIGAKRSRMGKRKQSSALDSVDRSMRKYETLETRGSA